MWPVPLSSLLAAQSNDLSAAVPAVTVAGVGPALMLAPLAVLSRAGALPSVPVVASATAAAAVLVLALQVVPVTFTAAVPRGGSRAASRPPPLDAVAARLAAPVLAFEVGQERRAVALVLPWRWAMAAVRAVGSRTAASVRYSDKQNKNRNVKQLRLPLLKVLDNIHKNTKNKLKLLWLGQC